MLMSVQSSNEEARQLLEKEIEKFFARGGKITELERGYTAFPDGNIPKVGQIHASMTAEEREARNAEARQARELEAARKRDERAKYQEEQRKKREAEKKERRAREAQEAAWFKRELELAAQEEAKELARKEAAQQRIAEIQAEHDARARRLEEKRKETEKKLAVKQAKHELLMIKMQQEQFERMERHKQQQLKKEQQRLEREEAAREKKLQAEKRKKLLAMTAAQRKQAEKLDKALKQQQRKQAQRELKQQQRKTKAARGPGLKLVQFKYQGDEYWRRAAQRVLRAGADQRGDNEFIGLCVHHNKTLFRISPSGLTRCVECKRMQNKARPAVQRKETENAKRVRENLERRNKAILEGKVEFTATCKRHGETTYRFRVDNRSYCVQCELDRQAAKRQAAKDSRHVRIREARTAAIQKGERYFEFECTKHGMTTYRISKVASVCMQCKRERDLARIRKMPEDQLSPDARRKRENRRRFEQAIANQQTHFIGICSIHGEGRYSTYPGTVNYGAGYRCVACKTEKTGRVVRKNLCNNLKNPDVVKFKAWVESRGYGELYRIARYLGLSRSSISHINNGRARITPENLEKLNQYYKENGGTDE